MGQTIKKWDKFGTVGHCPKNGTKGQDRTRQWDICPKKQGHLSS